jgi:GAF domain-containing protein
MSHDDLLRELGELATQGIAGWVVQSGQPIAISDLANDPRFSREVAEQTGYVPQAILAVPVETPQRMLGVISLLDRDSRRPGAEQDIALLALFADQAALARARTFAHRLASGIYGA